MKQDGDGFHDEVEVILKKCDELVGQLEGYMRNLQKEPLSPTLEQLNPMKKWNERRRDNRIQAQHEGLTGDIAETEVKLRELIATGTTKKEALRRQCSDLKGELIRHSGHLKMSISTMEEDEEQIREVVNMVTIETAELKNMVAFNKEIVRQVEAANFFANWGDPTQFGGSRAGSRGRGRSRKFNNRGSPRNSAEENDEDHQMYLDRLVQLRSSRDWLVTHLSNILEKKESVYVLESELRENLEIICKFEGVSGAGSKKEEVESIVTEAFAALKRGDIEKVATEEDEVLEHVAICNAEASSCCESLLELKNDILEANSRLRQLVESREMTKEATNIYQASVATTNKSSLSSENSSPSHGESPRGIEDDEMK